MASTGISLDPYRARRTTAGSAILFDKYSRTNKSIIFEVRNTPIVLSAFGLDVNESVVIYSVTRVGNQELEQIYLPEGKNVYLSAAITSIELTQAGRYRAKLNGILGNVVCSYTMQQADIGRDVGMPSGAQANRPNLLLKDSTDGAVSNTIEIADAPWVFFAFGLANTDKIYVYQVFGADTSFKEEVYKPDGKQVLFTANANSHTLDKSGRYRFKYVGTGTATLVGNPTSVEVQGKSDSGEFSGTTDDVPEGLINLYFTEDRVNAAIEASAVTLSGDQTIEDVKSFVDSPIVPTPDSGDNSGKAASTAFVIAEILTRLASLDAMVYKGAIDAGLNPNYPAANTGDTYRISVAGRIGGSLGPKVEKGDILICHTDGSPSGTQAAVGANWDIIQTNIDGALTISDVGVLVQAYSLNLQSLSSLVLSADKGIYATGTNTLNTFTLTAIGRTLLGAATASAQRTALGLGSMAIQDASAVDITGGTIDGVTIDGGFF